MDDQTAEMIKDLAIHSANQMTRAHHRVCDLVNEAVVYSFLGLETQYIMSDLAGSAVWLMAIRGMKGNDDIEEWIETDANDLARKDAAMIAYLALYHRLGRKANNWLESFKFAVATFRQLEQRKESFIGMDELLSRTDNTWRNYVQSKSE